jgi:hypothetical protein
MSVCDLQIISNNIMLVSSSLTNVMDSAKYFHESLDAKICLTMTQLMIEQDPGTCVSPSTLLTSMIAGVPDVLLIRMV